MIKRNGGKGRETREEGVVKEEREKKHGRVRVFIRLFSYACTCRCARAASILFFSLLFDLSLPSPLSLVLT